MHPALLFAQSDGVGAQGTDACADAGAVCTWVFELTDDERLAELAQGVVSPLVRVVLIALVAMLLVRVVKRVIQRTARRAKEGRRGSERSLQEGRGAAPARPRKAQRIDAVSAVSQSIASATIWTMAVLSILGAFGINLGPLIAGAGIVGLALGFGAQDLVKDFLSGFFLLAEDQFGVGDVIDVGEAVGVVEGISLRTTRVRDVTGTLWHVPNGEITRVGNMSQEWARALLDIGVSYDTDIDRAAAVIREVAAGMVEDEEYALDFLGEPELWGVENLGADSVDIRLVIKTTPGTQWRLARELRRRIKYALDGADIEIPFPQRTVWLRTDVTGTVRPEVLVRQDGPEQA